MSTIACVRTVRMTELPSLIGVKVEMDEGLTGLGESFPSAPATEAQPSGENR